MPLRYQGLIESVNEICLNTKKSKFFKILQIGVSDGYLSRQLIDRAAKNGRTNIEFYGVDLFEEMTEEINVIENNRNYRARLCSEVKAYISNKTKAKTIKLCKGPSARVLAEIVESLPKFDLIFIDGGQSLATVQSDFEYALKRCGSTGQIIIDNYYPGDHSKGSAFLVDSDLTKRQSLKVTVLEPHDVCDVTETHTHLVKVALTGKTDETLAPEALPHVEPERVSVDSIHNTDVQPHGLCPKICPDSTCEHAQQSCDGSRRCESRMATIHLELPTAGPVIDSPVSEQRQEPDQKLELGAAESERIEDTDNSSDEQRRDVSEELVQEPSEPASKRARRSRRTRNKRSRTQTDTTSSETDSELQDN